MENQADNSVDKFLDYLKSISPTQQKKTFVKRRTIEKIFCGFAGNHGKYQLLPINSVVNDSPFVVLKDTREINIPRKNIAVDGTESVYEAWIRLLPVEAYRMKDPNTGEIISSLSSENELILKQAYVLFDELYRELDVKNNLMDPTIKNFIRRKNYTIWNSYVLNYWQTGDTRNPARTNFSALFVVTAKGFIDIVGESIQDTKITSGFGNNEWIKDIYNRKDSGRTGYMMFSISKSESPGFNITVNHILGAGQYLSGVTINEEDLELMSNPVEEFLGWQANREDDSVPVDQRHLFNKKLIEETIQYMTKQLAKIRMTKQVGGKTSDAIAATNKAMLENQVPTDSRGNATNDPVLAQLNQQQQNNPVDNGFGGMNQEMQTPPATHINPLSGGPESAPFSRPNFAGGNNGQLF